MRKGAIVDLVKDLVAKANLVEEKSKNKFTEWGDGSKEEHESLTRDTSNEEKGVVM